MRARIIHLINPETYSATTRPLYMNRALYSPLAGLLSVAASIPLHSPRRKEGVVLVVGSSSASGAPPREKRGAS